MERGSGGRQGSQQTAGALSFDVEAEQKSAEKLGGDTGAHPRSQQGTHPPEASQTRHVAISLIGGPSPFLKSSQPPFSIPGGYGWMTSVFRSQSHGCGHLLPTEPLQTHTNWVIVCANL